MSSLPLRALTTAPGALVAAATTIGSQASFMFDTLVTK